MTIVRLVATTRQMVSVGTKGAQAVTDGLPYIPGSTLRGALSASWLRDHDQRENRNDFVEIFERSRFGPLLPVGGQLVPRSYKEHKYAPADGCEAVTSPQAPGSGDDRCVNCGQHLVPVKQAIKPPPQILIGGEPLMTSRARVELNTDETAKEGQLFERTGLRPRTVLSGHAYVTEPAQAWLGDGLTVRVGGSVSVTGELRLTVREEEAGAEPRLVANGRAVTLILGSPGIFVDVAGRPTDRPSRDELSHVVGLTCDEVDIVAVRRIRVGGWHTASGLPKPGDWAADVGSTFNAYFASEPSRNQLAKLARHGIGLRRSEGFGWLAAPSVRSLPPSLLRQLAQPRRTAVLEHLIGLVEKDLNAMMAGLSPSAALAQLKAMTNLPAEIAALSDVDHPADLAAALNALTSARQGRRTS